MDARETVYFLSNLTMTHLRDLGDFHAFFIEDTDVEEMSKVFISIIPDIRSRPLWFNDAISFFPNTDGMGFYPDILSISFIEYTTIFSNPVSPI